MALDLHQTDRTNFKRTKSLMETSHVNTLKILEQKFGGSPSPAEITTQKTTKTQAEETESSSGAARGVDTTKENINTTSIAKDALPIPPPPGE